LTIEVDAGPDQGHIVVLTEATSRMSFSGAENCVYKIEGTSPGARLRSPRPETTTHAIPKDMGYIDARQAVQRGKTT
jgi:hypothetical protein